MSYFKTDPSERNNVLLKKNRIREGVVGKYEDDTRMMEMLGALSFSLKGAGVGVGMLRVRGGHSAT